MFLGVLIPTAAAVFIVSSRASDIMALLPGAHFFTDGPLSIATLLRVIVISRFGCKCYSIPVAWTPVSTFLYHHQQRQHVLYQHHFQQCVHPLSPLRVHPLSPLDADTGNTGPVTIAAHAAGSPGTAHAHHTTNPHSGVPKIFGCWNFLHQAMSEIEQFEDERQHQHLLLLRQQQQRQATTHTNVHADATIRHTLPPGLLSETRLLAEFNRLP